MPLTLEQAEEKIRRHSPYLTRLLEQHSDLPGELEAKGADAAFASLMASLPKTPDTLGENPQDELMTLLRNAKGRLALLTAFMDITGKWELERVTGALSEFAGYATCIALDTLLLMAHQRGEIELADASKPSHNSGIIILAMGKLGAFELNYSSDIDLIVFFERGQITYKGRHNEQHFMNKLAHDLVHILQERNRYGYVFRTDLRLRPDPASTPPAISTAAAYYYYESVGQNWERAAMIKARAIAGDIPAGEQFLKNISPFMWRRSLDFASINDIHSIKRQMDSRQSKEIQVKGHNIKLGMGGIREIEFYVQIHQLIWGGRQPSLRVRPTCETLERLLELKLVSEEIVATLKPAYVFLRNLEHRLQMVGDEQTHTVPVSDEDIAHIADFMNFASVKEFEETLLTHLRAVHDIYLASFRGAENLSDEGNLVFTGVSHDPETLATLRSMGYANPETVSEIVMGWHHGSRRATRTKRARELLTELMPVLLKRLAETANPDAAFLKFNEFLSNLPAGVQLFSLFNVNPQLLGLIADILGSAPTLADHLSKSPGMLDAVLHADFYEKLPGHDKLIEQWRDMDSLSRDFEDHMNTLRRFRNEKQFQAGVQFLKGMNGTHETGHFLADLADMAIEATLAATCKEFEKTYGKIKDSSFAVIGLGKLGSREMTFGSDIDLVFVYDVKDEDAQSDGEKPLGPSVYYNRLAQRLIGALSTMEREGRLYEVDTRLRPSGSQGALAVSMAGLEHYFAELAWTFEYMAFTKARPVAGDKKLREALEAFIIRQLAKPRDKNKLKAHVIDMRERIEKAHGTNDPWNIKYVGGGLIDIDFIAQYLLLKHAPDMQDMQPGAAVEIYQRLSESGLLDAKSSSALINADAFLGKIFNMLRLCAGGTLNEESALPGLRKLLCEAVGATSFDDLKARLISVEEEVRAHYSSLVTA